MRESTAELNERLGTAQSLLCVALTNTLALQNDSDEQDAFVASLDAIWLSFCLCCKDPYDDKANQSFMLDFVSESYGEGNVTTGYVAVQLVEHYFATKDTRMKTRYTKEE